MKRLKSPLDVQIELTEHCNQCCRHCYNYWRNANDFSTTKELCLDEFLSIINQLHEARVGLITFTGGEPMLRKEVLFELIAYTHNLGMEVGLNSNGVLITENDARILAKNGLDHALISLLGPESLHESIAGCGSDFEATKNGIRLLNGSNIPVSTNMVVSNLNLQTMWETACIAKELGVRTFCAGPVVPSYKSAVPLCLSPEECKSCLLELVRIGEELSMNVDVLEPIARCLFNKEEEHRFMRFFGNRMCSAAVSSCAISPFGDMRPCIHSDKVYGNVLPDRFSDVWKNMEEWSLPSILPDKCQSCGAITICEGGCRMSARTMCGQYNGPDMYMTEPITDLNRILIGASISEDVLIGISEPLEFNKRCVIREEEDGRYIVFYGGKLQCLTEKGIGFVLLLKDAGTFTVCSVAEKTGFSNREITPILARLLRNGIIFRKNIS